jgi:hypothetical protein
MKYESPQVTTLTPAINAIQTAAGSSKMNGSNFDSLDPTTGNPYNEVIGAYQDWD